VIFRFEAREPDIVATEYYVAESAQVIGSVRIHQDVSVWFNAVIRGDNGWIELGARSNVQDNAVVHCDPGTEVKIGAGVTIGHGAILHSCTVADDALIGMAATIMDGAHIGRNCIVAAGAFVSPRKVIPDGVLVAGWPARVVRELTNEERDHIALSSQQYVRSAARYKAALRPLLV